jgi:hypothetical protein
MIPPSSVSSPYPALTQRKPRFGAFATQEESTLNTANSNSSPSPAQTVYLSSISAFTNLGTDPYAAEDVVEILTLAAKRSTLLNASQPESSACLEEGVYGAEGAFLRKMELMTLVAVAAIKKHDIRRGVSSALIREIREAPANEYRATACLKQLLTELGKEEHQPLELLLKDTPYSLLIPKNIAEGALSLETLYISFILPQTV